MIVALGLIWATQATAQTPPFAKRQKIVIDTDIGDDVDDAFALALALQSPELQILGVTTTFGETNVRAKLAERFLGETGRGEIPVASGAPTPPKGLFTQREYAEGGQSTKALQPSAVDFILEQIHDYPGEITLVCIGPLTNVGALIDKDPEAFHRLKRVVVMGGSIKRGYGDLDGYRPHGPDREWNIVNDISSAQKLFRSGVPIYLMPLDATQLKLDEVKRAFLFREGTRITKELAVLYYQWGQETPTLYDPMTIAAIIDPGLCPVQPMHVRVDDLGFTRAEAGLPNANVCMQSDSEAFFRFYLGRFTHPSEKR